MADIVTTAKRSAMMSGIRGRDTKPELAVRRYLHAKGLRYRLFARELPGRPDIVFSRYRTVVFVHGCFWHRHPGCRYAYRPTSNRAFWEAKISGNVDRDGRTTRDLARLEWRVLTIWECEIGDVALDKLCSAIMDGKQFADALGIKPEAKFRSERRT